MKKEYPERNISRKTSAEGFVLVLINDDINTFDHVIRGEMK